MEVDSDYRGGDQVVLGVAREGGLPDVGVGDQDPGCQGGGGQVAKRQQQVDQSLLQKQNIETLAH